MDPLADPGQDRPYLAADQSHLQQHVDMPLHWTGKDMSFFVPLKFFGKQKRAKQRSFGQSTMDLHMTKGVTPFVLNWKKTKKPNP